VPLFQGTVCGMITRAIVYLRQSRDVEGTRAAVDRQLEDCERLCDRMGWTIVRTHTDNDVSASSKKARPGYDALFADVRADACDVVVAWAQDRLLRDVREGEDLIDLVEKHGVRVATVQGGDHDLASPDGRMHVRMMAVIARGEMEKKGARQRRQQLQAAEQGLPPSRGLFGYRKNRDTGRLELYEPEATVVREAFDRLFKGQSINSLTKWMAESGTVSIRGNRWTNRMVSAMLLNPRYASVRCYYGQRMATGQWPAIVTEAEREKAVALLSEPSRKTNHFGPARKWLGGGLYRCGRCGGSMRSGYRDDHVRIYMCREGKHLTRTAEPVDRWVVDAVSVRLAMDDVGEALVPKDTPELSALRTEAEALRRRLDLARDRLDRGVLDEDEFMATKRTIKDELSVVERKMTGVARTSVLSELMDEEDRVAAFLAMDLAGQRRIIDAVCTVTLLPGTPGRKPFNPATVRIDWK
jgi:site-specific DNA recombinase